jgi:hypothetical protein
MARATQRTPEGWRAEVERAYGSPLPAESWDYLVGRRFIQELDDGFSTVEDVVDELRTLNRAAPTARSRSKRRVKKSGVAELFKGINSRMEAIAEIIAMRAGESTSVRSFRHRFLNDGLVEPDEVTAWIANTYRSQLPTGWPESPNPTDATNFRGKFATWPHEHEVLEWLNRGSPTSQIWCVPTTGPLAELARMTRKLADTWDWSVPLATTFVLTGETPARPGVRGISFRRRAGSDDTYGAYEYMSVRCLIDIEVTPEELAAWWRGVRAALGLAGRRPVGEKSVQLALFALTREAGTTWRDDMQAWNEQCRPDRRFNDYAAYRTAVVSALKALNQPAASARMP